MGATAGAEAVVERELETTHLQRVVDHSRHGVGRVVVIQGPAGIGKTTVLEAARGLARDAGMRVRTCRGAELEQGFPFGLVRQLFDPLLSAAEESDRGEWLAGAAKLAAPLFAARAPLHLPLGDESIYPLLHGLCWLSANIAREQPLALLVDDAVRRGATRLAEQERAEIAASGERVSARGVRCRVPDAQRTKGGRAGGRRPHQPQHRAHAIHQREDRRDPSRARVCEARRAYAPQASRCARMSA
jgi:energy-coupling factor transporter ATP-binding protein EcfA2